MNTVIRIVKRGEKETRIIANDERAGQDRKKEIVRTVKAWIAESRERRTAKADYPPWLKRAREESKSVKKPGTKIVFDGLIPDPANG
jgi:hypothetical protein